MICPGCQAEYVTGVTVCRDCGVDLVESVGRSEPASVEEPAPVVAFVTSDPGLMAIAQTMLESARIPVMVQGGAHHGFFGTGPLGGLHPGGPLVLRVAPRDAEDARAALAELLADSEGPGAQRR